MKSIRKFAYATLLALTTVSFTPSLASAQDAHGSFTLEHDVHWEKAFVPAGTYRFSYESQGPAGLLLLRKISGPGAGYLVYVRDIEESKPTDVDQLLLQSTPGGSYVSTMQLPQFGMTFRFVVPPTAEKQIASAATPATASVR